MNKEGGVRGEQKSANERMGTRVEHGRTGFVQKAFNMFFTALLRLVRHNGLWELKSPVQGGYPNINEIFVQIRVALVQLIPFFHCSIISL